MAPREFDPDCDQWKGDQSGRLVAIVYGDYVCPQCRRALHPGAPIVDRIEELGLYVFRQRPSPSYAPEAERAARAALAAGRQGRFWEMHARLFEYDDFSDHAIGEHADAIGLDRAQFEADCASPDVLEQLEAERAEAERAGVWATPSLFINGRLYDGPWDRIAVVEALERPIRTQITGAFRDFFNWAASGGLVLVLATLVALIVANIGLHEWYEALLATDLGVNLGADRFSMPLEAWINDGLMAIFFLLVGIEIKREVLDGELSDPASAALPVIAALGGMLAPALIYAAVNWGGSAAHGWGVPMATDIAFTIGLMALLGARAPASLKIFVSALAVADDLGAIIVIALFYGEGFEASAALYALLFFALMLGLNVAKIYARAPYMLAGLVLWWFLQKSGLHATLAGVLTAIAIPSRPHGDIAGIAAQTRAILDHGAERGGVGAEMMRRLEGAIDRLREPGHHVERRLQGASTFFILPLFAFFNTGVPVIGSSFSPLAPESLGVLLGLIVGKPLGVVLFSLAAVRLGWARLPSGVSRMQLIGAGCLAGVGFTMSIFIASAAFSAEELETVKLSVLLASTCAALIGAAVLWRADRR